jgi:hypothetical protein
MWVSAALRAAETHLLRMVQDLSYLTLSSWSESAQEYGILLRKVRAYGNFTEYVPLALLFILVLELMESPVGLIWLLGGPITVARIAHAWGLINVYGPSVGRVIGFFLTWFVYLLGSGACLYYGILGL